MDFQSLGQLFFVGIPGTTLDDETRAWLRQMRPGGVILFARNVESWEQLDQLCADLHAHDPQLWIGIDQEGGRVDRLRKLTGNTPGASVLAKNGGPPALEQFGDCLGELLASADIDIDFVPVLDVEQNDSDNALRGRCMGSTVDAVAGNANAFLNGLQCWGLRVSGKHFPGLGGARVDSHFQLPVIDKTLAQLWYEDIAPFQRLQHRLDSIMVSHAVYTGVDEDRPASVSPLVLRYLLFHKLRYGGLVFTDDLEMGAVHAWGTPLEIAREALTAGVHCLVYSHNQTSSFPIWEELCRTVGADLAWSARLHARLDQLAAVKAEPRPRLSPVRARALQRLAALQEKYSD
ncbi:MAG: beta-N-acetylhexosaminidase [Acidobacteriota bacterium]